MLYELTRAEFLCCYCEAHTERRNVTTINSYQCTWLYLLGTQHVPRLRGLQSTRSAPFHAMQCVTIGSYSRVRAALPVRLVVSFVMIKSSSVYSRPIGRLVVPRTHVSPKLEHRHMVFCLPVPACSLECVINSTDILIQLDKYQYGYDQRTVQWSFSIGALRSNDSSALLRSQSPLEA